MVRCRAYAPRKWGRGRYSLKERITLETSLTDVGNIYERVLSLRVNGNTPTNVGKRAVCFSKQTLLWKHPHGSGETYIERLLHLGE